MRQGEAMLSRTVQEATEQIRLLRSAKYQLDRDLADKSKASPHLIKSMRIFQKNFWEIIQVGMVHHYFSI